MAEQSVNVTLQQVTISHYKSLTSLSDLSAPEYEDEYSFLTDNSLSEQHVQISNVRLNPPQQNYQVRFYEIRNYDKLRKQSLQRFSERYISQEQNAKHKIMSLNVKQKNSWEKVACLPRSNYPIELQVQSKGEQILFGKIKQEENEIESQLFNANGQKIASLQYDLKLPKDKKDESRLSLFFGQRQNTLHSADFESQSENTPRLKEFSHEEKLGKTEKQLSDKLGKIQEEDEHKADKITTMSTSSKVVRIVRRRKKLQSLSEQNSQIQQKGEQDYELNLQEKVSSYRNPFQKKEKYLAYQTKEVDFLSLKRSKEELGIPFINFEDMIYPKSLRNKAQINQQQEQQNQLIKVLNPQMKCKTQASSGSHRICYQDCGVGTYTPLSTLKSTMKQSYNSFIQKNMRSHGVQTKIAKSTNLKLEKLVQQKKRYEQQCQVKESEYEEQQSHQSYAQKRSILKKFFMTNREQERNRLKQNKKTQIARQNLSVQNKVLEIKVQQFPKVDKKIIKNEESISPVSLQRIKSRPKKSQSCRDTPQKIESELISLSDSELYPEYNLTINNVSLNFRRKTFGNKQLMIKLGDTSYLTEKIVGNNLMWASKSYRFQRVSQTNEINIDVRGETTEHQFLFGTVKIAFNDLLINKKQRYYQTFLLGQKEVLGILILGYQILKKKDSLKKYIFPQQQRRQYSQSETKRIEDQMRQAKKLKKLENFLNQDLKKKLPSPQANKIKIKKYLGGKNIKIGRASRFQDSNILIPGPGQYQIQSDFNRHAMKQE